MISPAPLPAPPRRSAGSLPLEARLRLDRRLMRDAARAIQVAYPRWHPGERRRLLAHAVRHQAARPLTERALQRLSEVALCRRLTIQGWDNLLEAETRGKGVIVVSASLGIWQAALRALAIYRRRVRLLLEPDTDLARQAATLARRCDVETQPLAAHGEAAGASPKSGEVALLLVGRSAGVLEGGVDERLCSRAAAWSLTGGAPLVPLFAIGAGGRRFRLRIHPPIWPEPQDSPTTLATRCLDVVAAEIRRFPEQWSGWFASGDRERPAAAPIGEPR